MDTGEFIQLHWILDLFSSREIRAPEIPCLLLNCGLTLLIYYCLFRGSPIGSSGSGIWRIWRPGFGILVKRENEIRDCNCERDARCGDFTLWDSGSCSLKNRDSGGPVMKIQNKTQLSGDRHHLREFWTCRKEPLSRLSTVGFPWSPIRTYQVHHPIRV